MMRRFFALTLVFSIVATTGAGCFRFQEEKSQTKSSDFKPVTAAMIPEPQEQQEVIELPPDDLEAPESLDLPNIQAGEHWSQAQNIILSSIIRNQMLQNPFVLLGRARSLDLLVGWRLKDSRNNILSEGTAKTNAVDPARYGAFYASVYYDRVPESSAGTLELFTRSGGTFRDAERLIVPVRFPQELTPVKLYFANLKKDPNRAQCDIVYPTTRRFVKTGAPMEAAIRELIEGPTIAELTEGHATTMLPTTRILSLEQKHGVVTLNLSNEVTFALEDDCTKQTLRAQLNETLMQFEGIETVRILIEGKDATKLLSP